MTFRIALVAGALFVAAPALACPFAQKTADAGPMSPMTTAQGPSIPAPTTTQQ